MKAWIATIAYNLRVDGARAARREAAVFSREESDLDAFPSAQRSPETLAMLREACGRISDVLDRMPPPSKRAFLLYYFEGLTHAQIGATLGITEAAAKMRCVRVHEKLVEELGEHVFDVLNDLRCRLPPLFFEDARAERRRVERMRKAYEATRHTATCCAFSVASVLAGLRVEMPLAQTGLQLPSIRIEVRADKPLTHEAHEALPAQASIASTVATVSTPRRASGRPATSSAQKSETSADGDAPYNGSRERPLYLRRTH